MHTNRGSKLGGMCAILIGTINVLLVIYVVFTPAEQRYGTGEFLRYYAESPLPLSVAWVMLTATSVLAFAVVPAVGDYLRVEGGEWLRAAGIYAVVGFAVMAVSFLTLIGKAPDLAQAYVSGDEATRAAMAAVGLPELDPNGWLMFGGAGVWTLVVSVVGLRSGKLSKAHALLGIPCGLCYWATVFADVFTLEALNLIAAGGGAILAPVWHVWMGLRLLKASQSRAGFDSRLLAAG